MYSVSLNCFYKSKEVIVSIKKMKYCHITYGQKYIQEENIAKNCYERPGVEYNKSVILFRKLKHIMLKI